MSDFLFRFTLTVILSAVTASFLVPFIKEVISSEAAAKLLDALKGVIGAFFSAGTEMAAGSEALSEANREFFSMLGDKMGDITLVAIGVIAVLIVYAMFFGFANYASGVVINSYMSSLSKIGYVSAILHGFGKCFMYQLISVFAFIIWNIVLFTASYFTFVLTASALLVMSLPLAVLILVAGNALYGVFFSCFLPSLTAGGNGIIKGIKESFSLGAKKFGELFAQFIFIILFVFYANVSVTVFTLGAGFIFSLPATCVCITCLKLVNYYSFVGRKYYIDYDNIIVPPGMKSEEDGFINGIDM